MIGLFGRLEKEKAERKIRNETIKSERERREERRKDEKLKRENRMEKHAMLKQRWETIRWITKYLDENEELWEIERMERELEHQKKIDEWEKAKRFERIKILKNKKKVKPIPTKPSEAWTWQAWRDTDYTRSDSSGWPTDTLDFMFSDTTPD